MKRIFGILLAIGMMVSFVNTNLQNDVYADISIFEETEIAPEQKIYSTATLEDDFVDNEVIVVLTHETSMKFHEYTVDDFPEIECVDVQDLTKYTKDIRKNSYQQIQKREMNPFSNVFKNYEELVSEQQEKNLVERYNQILRIELKDRSKKSVLEAIDILQKRTDVLSAEVDAPVSVEVTPNDPMLSSQWAINKIQLPVAWNLVSDFSKVKVGILDSGIDGDHVDLKNVIDTSLCMDFSNDSNGVYVGKPKDVQYHGTHVAGIIGAQGNNAIGVCGVCWNVQLVSLQVFHLNEKGKLEANSGTIAYAIDYAEKNGIKILNYSGGGYDYSSSQYNAIDNYSGLFVCSAGNESYDTDETPHYPSSYTNKLDNLISVGSCTSDDVISDFSNYGKESVDLFAPGTEIYSTMPGNKYDYLDGTSMAAPYVTGVAALISAKHPGITPSLIKKTILSHVDKIDSFANICVSGGRLNAYNVLTHSDYIYLNEGNPSYHRIKCAKCGFVFSSESHDMAISSVDSNHHQSKCRICGYANANTLADHTYKYSNITSAKHIETCTVCGRKAQVNHVYKNCKDYGNATYHQGTCLCGHYSTTVPHNWTQKTGNKLPTASSTSSDSVNAYVWYECVDCGRISLTQPQNISSSILYVIQPNDKFLHLLSSYLN